jgi:hypothetical protein
MPQQILGTRKGVMHVATIMTHRKGVMDVATVWDTRNSVCVMHVARVMMH